MQHVDVCMFSNGKFKNIVAEVDVSKQVGAGESLHGVFSLLPVRGMSNLFDSENGGGKLGGLKSFFRIRTSHFHPQAIS